MNLTLLISILTPIPHYFLTLTLLRKMIFPLLLRRIYHLGHISNVSFVLCAKTG